MNSIKNIVLMFISIFLLSFWLDTYASHDFTDLEKKIYQKSASSQIKKMQLVLKDLNLYSGEIDGNYNSVKNSLITYQKKAGITKHLWYFWVKTLTALKRDYPNKFEEVTNKYLKIVEPSKEVQEFIVTAYYSALPWQERYSYSSKLKRYRTYSEAIRMQWRWTHWASWKAVHVWFIAAPPNYKFWTKIELEWLWVWVVEDRWQAIVNAWDRKFENDRIDIWMWYGDEWRLRADNWGTRTIKWKIVPSDTQISIKFSNSTIYKYSKLKVDAEKPKKENVIKLQKLLTEVKKYNWPTDWNFNKVKNTLIKYQIEKGIIKSKNDPHAWYFWNKTYLALRKDFWWDIFILNNNSFSSDNLSKDMKNKLDLLNKKISKIVDKKYWKNTPKAKQYRANLRKIIDRKLVQIKNKERKKYLKYLKSII